MTLSRHTRFFLSPHRHFSQIFSTNGKYIAFVQKISVLSIEKRPCLCFNSSVSEVSFVNCFIIDLNHTPRILLSSKEHLIPPRVHLTRTTNTYIMYFVTAGRLPLRLNGETVELKAGDVYIFDKGSSQAPTEEVDCEYFYIHFECEMTSRNLEDDELILEIQRKNRAFIDSDILDYSRYENMQTILPQKMHIESPEAMEYLIGKFKKIKLNVWSINIAQRLEICQGIAALFVELEKVLTDSYPMSKKYKYPLGTSRVRQISDFVESNYNKDISSSDIERIFAISYDHANRLFKQHMGMGIISYRNRLRIEKAKMLLLTTEKTMEEISDEVGFSDKYYFSKFFKKTVGVCPTHFKRGDHVAI